MNNGVPGVRTGRLIPHLKRFESRGVTFLSDDFPVFWDSAEGAIIHDVDGNRFIDLTAAFGVANTGHSNPRVAASVADQASRLMHAMGDVHPTEVKSQFLEKLAAISPVGLRKSILCSTGAEAVEAAMKTAMLATDKPAFAAFKAGYHGLSFGALAVCGMERFRTPFLRALPNSTLFLDYPNSATGPPEDGCTLLELIEQRLKARPDVGGMIVELIQARGGTVVPPAGFLAGLRALCDELSIVLIFDEIYTGFGRTGAMFAAQHEGVVPDIMCIGKALANGFPISAAIGKPRVMDAWEPSRGEALHTSTYLGNPMGCAAALTNIAELQRLELPARAAQLGERLGSRLNRLRHSPAVVDIRGRGLMWGVQLLDAVLASQTVKNALCAGVVLLQSGERGDVISITPPLVIGEADLFHAVTILESVIDGLACAHV